MSLEQKGTNSCWEHDLLLPIPQDPSHPIYKPLYNILEGGSFNKKVPPTSLVLCLHAVGGSLRWPSLCRVLPHCCPDHGQAWNLPPPCPTSPLPILCSVLCSHLSYFFLLFWAILESSPKRCLFSEHQPPSRPVTCLFPKYTFSVNKGSLSAQGRTQSS